MENEELNRKKTKTHVDESKKKKKCIYRRHFEENLMKNRTERN